MNILKKIIILLLRKRGYSNYFANHILEERYQDFFLNKNTTIKEKVWAQKRGFLSDKIAFYGLTEDNYRDYLADFDYWKMHPINGQFGHWIDDKLTVRYILQPFQQFLPDYFFLLGSGEILRLMDCPEDLGKSIDDIILLLKNKRCLAVKLLSGSAGEGFIKLHFQDGDFYINNKLAYEGQLTSVFSGLIEQSAMYLVTEFLRPNMNLAKIWSDTANTLRLTVLREKNQQAQIISALIRFGTNKSGIIDNALAGGVFSKVNILTGVFKHGKIAQQGVLKDCPIHPDSNKKIEGVVPHWDFLTKKTLEICQYIPQVVCMGIDLIVTDEGFKLIEINSHPNIEFIQYDVPAFKNDLCSNFYKRRLKKSHRLR